MRLRRTEISRLEQHPPPTFSYPATSQHYDYIEMSAVHDSNLADALRTRGHVFVDAAGMRKELANRGSLADWDAFAASWDDMPLDAYMADGGRYRRRRHAAFSVDLSGKLVPQPHRPHYQSRDYNNLNGGIPRWFEPISREIMRGDSLTTIIDFSAAVFGAVAGYRRDWDVEIHQFRIEARAGEQGLPTPEGVHRDGVDYVLVLLITRQNIAQGMTEIFTPGGEALGHFTLTAPFDAVLLDDSRVYHGVTAVTALDTQHSAWRDVLVVTFRKDQT